MPTKTGIADPTQANLRDLLEALRDIAAAARLDPYNAAAMKQLALAQETLLDSAAGAKVPRLRSQCAHTTLAALALAPGDETLHRQRERWERTGRTLAAETDAPLATRAEGLRSITATRPASAAVGTEIRGAAETRCAAGVADTSDASTPAWPPSALQFRLPAVFLLGFQKCGTTSLFEWIVTVGGGRFEAPLSGKEAHFFSNDVAFARGLDHYASLWPRSGANSVDGFADRRRDARKPSLGRTNSERPVIRIDGTPDYIWHHLDRLFEAYGGSKSPEVRALRFVLIVRDPIDRLQSWWNSFRPQGWINDVIAAHTTLSHFALAAAASYVGCVPGSECALHVPSRRRNWGRLSGVGAGFYTLWLQRLMDAGAEGQQVHLVFLSRLGVPGPTCEAEMDALLRFLGLASARGLSKPALPQRNTSGTRGTSEEGAKLERLSEEAREALKHVYKPWNCALAALVQEGRVSHADIMLPAWLQGCDEHDTPASFEDKDLRKDGR
jgi:hypothetical protein